MKKFVHLLAILLVLTAAVGTGCKKKPVDITPIPGKIPGKIGGDRLPIGNPIGVGEATGPGGQDVFSGPVTPGSLASSERLMNQGTHDREKLKAETVYFDLDSATIKNSEKSKLDKVADYLKSNSADDVLIEGHCDERGTEGYNLALGEKRAQAAREYLASVGAPADRIFTQSYGEAHPAEEGQGESAYAKNRRTEFVVVPPAGK